MVRSAQASVSRNSCHSGIWTDPRVDLTFKAINWELLADVVCQHYEVQEANWGERKSGGYNLVRFLHLEDKNKTTAVVRVPLHPEDGMTPERAQLNGQRIASEVATMQYIEEFTTIPVPHVILHSSAADGEGVGSSYIVMTKVEGTLLAVEWDKMPDDKREIVLRQVADILLELASHRFDKIGALVKGEGEGRDAWKIEPLSCVCDPDGEDYDPNASEKTYSSGTDYWISKCNDKLKNIHENDFGSENKLYNYSFIWFLRSLIPALYDATLDESGFPLMPSDFHSQNIMVMDVETSPRITGVIDWEFCSTACTSSFAQYPFFIVDHPAWRDDHPQKPRNVRDQAAFNKIILEAEKKRDPNGDQPLSRAFANCQGVYLFEQCMSSNLMFNTLYPQLYSYVFGDEDGFSTDYYWALCEHGILRREIKRFENEVEVWKEAKEVLRDEIGEQIFTRTEFRKFARQHEARFPDGGKVQEWLKTAV
ncbi:uncharacterized protein FOMMEDRAFT_170389 [Fomitiporia mediterranea MF3/22]|uniref:uncharacterized protein n=1 Tax=Fomitiporia mediterranea (strain MF3/22) TaxID=694068 RepID=UPI000440973F|nr:uncharacterized protein FOMMEDRAFT_170389 [Fomitiporia mediterranea MF3/22]EJC99876.1 hypothetical protein FOMMEDRAFT_170389 [Fomitiporia mediterranea MF3/22]